MHHSQVRILNRLLAGIRIRILDRIEILHESDNSVTGFSKSILFYESS
jgi:hypothetical protein